MEKRRFAGDRGGIMVEASEDSTHWTYQAAIGADNPAFLKIEGKYYIYYKCGTPEHMKAKYGYAVSDRLEGPYRMCDAPITDNVSYLEDAQAFSVDGKYYLLTTGRERQWREGVRTVCVQGGVGGGQIPERQGQCGRRAMRQPAAAPSKAPTALAARSSQSPLRSVVQ